MTEKLEMWVRMAKRNILRYLEQVGQCERKELEGYVLNLLNRRETREGRVIHETKPIHVLAFVVAHKRLEMEQRIKIKRSSSLPFPVTDFKSVFVLVEGET